MLDTSIQEKCPDFEHYFKAFAIEFRAVLPTMSVFESFETVSSPDMSHVARQGH
jgi:hypothetical protein